MLSVVYTNSFSRDLKRVVRRGKDPKKIAAAIDLLCSGQPLPASFRDHALSGNYAGFRDCHIEPDLVLVYRVNAGQLQLICVRIGTHSDLFG